MRQLIFCLTVFLSATLMYGQTTFQKNYYWGLGQGVLIGGSGNWVTQTRDSNYLFIGNKLRDLFLSKTTASGDTLFVKSFNGITTSTAGWQSAYECSDGNIIVAGTNNVGSEDVFLMKFSGNGNLLWQKTYGNALYDYGYSVMENYNKEIIITGSSNIGTGKDDIFILRTDSVGNLILSTRVLDALNNYNQIGNCVRPSLDKGIILAGLNADALWDAIVIKCDSLSYISWIKKYGNSSDREEAKTILPLQDSTYVVLLNSYSLTPLLTGWTSLIKIDKSGNIIWAKDYDKVNNQTDKIRGRCLIQTKDKGFLIGGDALLKTDSLGNALWCKSKNIFIADIKQTFDKGYILTGYGNYGIPGGSAILLKLDSIGSGGCYDSAFTITTSNSPLTATNPLVAIGAAVFTTKSTTLTATNLEMIIDTSCKIWIYNTLNEIIPSNNISIFPNPFSTQTTVYADNMLRNATVTVYNSYGQIVKYIDPFTGHTIVLHRDNLPGGLYFLRITQDNNTLTTKKIVIED